MSYEDQRNPPSRKDSLFIWTVLTLCLAIWAIGAFLIVNYRSEILALLTGGF